MKELVMAKKKKEDSIGGFKTRIEKDLTNYQNKYKFEVDSKKEKKKK